MTARQFTDPATGETVVNPVVLYHAPCPDGFAAALCAWRYFEGQGEYIGISHGEEPPDLAGRSVYILDIAFSASVMHRISDQVERLVLLDHHQSAAEALHGFKCRCGSITFDLDKSASRMAWDYFNPGKEAPSLIQHVEDRDLIRWLHEGSPAYLLALDAGPYIFQRWNGILNMSPRKFTEFLLRGKAMYTMYRKQVEQIAADAFAVTIEGQHGMLANAPFTFHTDVGLLLARECGTYAAVWCLEPHQGVQRVRVGLRGADGFDTIPIATAFGGGGHPNASAFRIPLDRLGALLNGALRA